MLVTNMSGHRGYQQCKSRNASKKLEYVRPKARGILEAWRKQQQR